MSRILAVDWKMLTDLLSTIGTGFFGGVPRSGSWITPRLRRRRENAVASCLEQKRSPQPLRLR